MRVKASCDAFRFRLPHDSSHFSNIHKALNQPRSDSSIEASRRIAAKKDRRRIIDLFVFLLIVALLMGFVPGVIAKRNKHPNVAGVRALGLIGIVLPILWIAALIWAFVGARPHESQSPLEVIKYQRKKTFEVIGIDKLGRQQRLIVNAEDKDEARFIAVEREINVHALRENTANDTIHQYLIGGTDKLTGKIRNTIVEAMNREEASRIALVHGFGVITMVELWDD